MPARLRAPMLNGRPARAHAGATAGPDAAGHHPVSAAPPSRHIRAAACHPGDVRRGTHGVPAGERAADPAVPRSVQADDDGEHHLSRRLAARGLRRDRAWPTCSSTCCSRARRATPTSRRNSMRMAPVPTARPGTTGPTTSRPSPPATPTWSGPSISRPTGWSTASSPRKALKTEFTVVRNEFELGENDPGGDPGGAGPVDRLPLAQLRQLDDRGPVRHRGGAGGAAEELLPPLLPAGQCGARGGGQDRFRGGRCSWWFRSSAGFPGPTAPGCSRSTRPTPGSRCRTASGSVTLRRVGDVQVVTVAYHTPSGADSDFAAVDVLAHVLGDAPSGRLYQGLVAPGKAAERLGLRQPVPGAGHPGRLGARSARRTRSRWPGPRWRRRSSGSSPHRRQPRRWSGPRPGCSSAST